MITDKDVEKIKKRLEKTFVTKDEFKKAFKKLENKFDRRIGGVENSVKALSKDVLTVLEVVGDMSQKLDKKVIEHDDILEHHERQIDRLNDKVFPAT